MTVESIAALCASCAANQPALMGGSGSGHQDGGSIEDGGSLEDGGGFKDGVKMARASEGGQNM